MRTLVVDDSTAYRLFLKHTITAMPDCSYIGSASNGVEALKQIKALEPELVTLDIDMPILDGIGVLKALKEKDIKVPVVVVSALTHQGSKLTLNALELGAYDFITKPVSTDIESAQKSIRTQLEPLISGISMKTKRRPVSTRPDPAAITLAPKPKQKQKLPPKILAIGASTGGPAALGTLLETLPAHIGIPVVIVQHMPEIFTRSLALSLDQKSALTITEAKDGDLLKADHVYIAPGEKQMKIVRDKGQNKIVITDDPPEQFCKPSVNYLFDSIAEVFQGNVLALIMTGLGSDGVRGLGKLKQNGASVLGQDEESCSVYGMPRAAMNAGLVDEEVALEGMANKIITYIK